MTKMNFLGWGLVMILILTTIQLFDMAGAIETSGTMGTNSEKAYVEGLITGTTTNGKLGDYQTEIEGETKDIETTTIANDRDNVLFQDPGFSFVKFIGRMPKLLSFAVMGTTQMSERSENLPLIGRLMILLMLLPLNLISTYVLYKFIFT